MNCQGKHLFVFPDLSFCRLWAVRQEAGALLSWNQRLREPPAPPTAPYKGPIVRRPCKGPPRIERTGSCPNEPALGVALCGGFRPRCLCQGLPEGSIHISRSSGGGQWEPPALPFRLFLCIFCTLGECTHTPLLHRTENQTACFSSSLHLPAWGVGRRVPSPPVGPASTIVPLLLFLGLSWLLSPANRLMFPGPKQ